jgi:hypothetical protein
LIFGIIKNPKRSQPAAATKARSPRCIALRYCLSFGASATAIPLISFVEQRQGFVGLYLILVGFAALTFVATLVFPRTPSEAAVGQTA